jgi:hypothetical protein
MFHQMSAAEHHTITDVERGAVLSLTTIMITIVHAGAVTTELRTTNNANNAMIRASTAHKRAATKIASQMSAHRLHLAR